MLCRFLDLFTVSRVLYIEEIIDRYDNWITDWQRSFLRQTISEALTFAHNVRVGILWYTFVMTYD